MIENNVNAPATTLWNQVGRAAGLRPTTPPSACSRPRPRRAWCARVSRGRAGTDHHDPGRSAAPLRAAVNGPLLSPAARGYARLPDGERGTRPALGRQRRGSPRGPAGAEERLGLPSPPADTDWQVNSEGWIAGDGRDYLVAILTTGNPDEQYGIDTINTVSALLWPAMG